MRGSPWAGKVVTQVLLALWALATLFPLAIAVLSSVRNNKDIYVNPIGLDLSRIDWHNYVEAFNGPAGGSPLWVYLQNSVIVTVASLAIGTTCGVLAAYGLARRTDRVMGAVSRYLSALITIPILAILVPIFTLTGTLNIRDNVLGVALVYAATMIPGTTILTRPYFTSIPAELIEAATIDGAGEVRTFLRVVLPLALPAISAVVLVNAIWAWSELTLALVLLISPANKTLPVGLLAFQGQYFTDLGVQSAGLLIAAAPMVILYFFFSQRITQGMSAGAIK
ncbi:MAG: carbohydrate ABC transporter permease [Propionicimonas sp.]|nr:carbohydrate ABC transporter permease [Propionicimonas sp.]